VNPFPKGSWIVCSGRILGVLNRELIQGPHVVDSTVRILVILADDWEFVRQGALSTHNTSTPTSSNIANVLSTPPRLVGPGGVASRNPFSSPTRGRKLSPPKDAASPTLSLSLPASLPLRQQDREATELPTGPGVGDTLHTAATAEIDPVLTIPSSASDSIEHGSDIEQLLDDQLASTALRRKRKEPSSPRPVRSKRSIAGKKKTRL